MDVTQQEPPRLQQQSRQDNEEQDDERGEQQRGGPEGKRVEAAVPMDVDEGGSPPPNAAKRRSESVQGKRVEGCVTAGTGSNNNNGSRAATPSGNNGSVVEQIPAIVDRYVLHGKIDRGTFSTVTLATRRDEQHLPMERRRMFAIKLITQTSHPTRIEREIRCMMTIGGQCNVAEIVDGFRHQGSVGLVMNFIPHEAFHLYYAQLSPTEVQRYLRQLLIALERVHRHGVIHRDVKPSNFLHSRRNGGSFMLVDFGLAQETLTGDLMLCPSTLARGDKRKETSAPRAAPAVSIAQQPSVKRHKLPASAVANTEGAKDIVTFRNPLKQQQQNANNYSISPLKVSNNTLKDLVESPLARQVKSAAIGIANGMKSRRSGATVAPSQQQQACSERENTLKDLVDTPLLRQVKSTAIGVGVGLRHHRQSNPVGLPSPVAASAPAPARQSSDLPWCECYGQAQVCNRCLVKRELHAPRAGTPGYRPPEVLLKYPDQTTAVDIWAAGVIFLTLLSKCYPFFGNTDDMTSLAQIISVFGFERILETARNLDRTLLVAEETMRMKALSLRRVCQHYRELVRRRESGITAPSGDPSNPVDCCSNCVQPVDGCLCLQEEAEREGQGDRENEDGTDCDEYGAAAYDLLERMLETDPHKRITAADALQHPYFQVQY